MATRKNLILFGAGAVIDWDAPFTYELTDLVRNSGYYTTDNKTRITEFIYQKLNKESQYNESDINFETVINVIEELIIYYSSFNTKLKTPSILKSFFLPKYEDKLLNFSIEGQVKHGFKLEIPKGKSSDYTRRAVNGETPEEFFFKQLLYNILTNIEYRIIEYAYHAKGLSEVITDKNLKANLVFSKWIKKIVNNAALRMYTLNYDRNFKIIIEKYLPGTKIFEGFDCDATLEFGSRIKPNLLKIIDDNDCNVHYNLHGSIFWEVEARDYSQLPNPYFYLTEYPNLPINLSEYPTKQSEKGKTILLSNIITGYQKTQRSIFSPFKQMVSAFDKDCMLAEHIYIIGYSFNDEHINTSLRTALEYNKNLKITIVEPSFTKNNFDVNVAIKIFSSLDNTFSIIPKTIKPKTHSFYDGKIIVYEMKFMDYLITEN